MLYPVHLGCVPRKLPLAHVAHIRHLQLVSSSWRRCTDSEAVLQSINHSTISQHLNVWLICVDSNSNTIRCDHLASNFGRAWLHKDRCRPDGQLLRCCHAVGFDCASRPGLGNACDRIIDGVRWGARDPFDLQKKRPR